MNQVRTLILFAFLGFGSGISQAQDFGFDLAAEEAQLAAKFKKMLEADSDSERLDWNEKILLHFEDLLYDEASFQYPFDSLTSIGILSSDDGLLRIYNWNVMLSNQSNRYFGFIHYFLERKNEYLVFKLTDRSDELENPEFKSLNHENWYGALYTQILTRKYRKETGYTLLAWDGNDGLSKRKLIDYLTFTASGKPRFAENVFEMHYVKDNGIKRIRTQKRVIFEYSARASMMLRWDPDEKMIVFDHLVPIQDHYRGNFRFYGPDMTQDALVFKKGKWIHLEDVDVRRSKNDEARSWQYKPSEDFYKPK